jgi:hypothetical protein
LLQRTWPVWLLHSFTPPDWLTILIFQRDMHAVISSRAQTTQCATNCADSRHSQPQSIWIVIYERVHFRNARRLYDIIGASSSCLCGGSSGSRPRACSISHMTISDSQPQACVRPSLPWENRLCTQRCTVCNEHNRSSSFIALHISISPSYAYSLRVEGSYSY